MAARVHGFWIDRVVPEVSPPPVLQGLVDKVAERLRCNCCNFRWQPDAGCSSLLMEMPFEHSFRFWPCLQKALAASAREQTHLAVDNKLHK